MVKFRGYWNLLEDYYEFYNNGGGNQKLMEMKHNENDILLEPKEKNHGKQKYNETIKNNGRGD